jgi:hypothetical protein
MAITMREPPAGGTECSLQEMCLMGRARLPGLAAATNWLLVALLAACAPARQVEPPAAVREIDSPAGPASAQPRLALDPYRRVVLSWMEPAEPGHRLRYAVRETGAWSAPATVAEGEGFFVNWADVPSVVPLADGTFAAHWLQKNGDGPYAYDVRMRTSRDGLQWSDPFAPHRDNTETEHGFVSIVDWPEGGGLAVWLDGREMAGHDAHGAGMPGAMALRMATFDADGTPGPERVLDDRVCECCPTAAIRAGNSVVVAYRDRSEEEIRDIYVTRYDGRGWSEPARIHADDWQISGCPVNGPSLGAHEANVALAWFTLVDGDARVLVAFSADEGTTFGDPVRVDDGRPLGRVAAEMLPDGSALVAWLEHLESSAELRVRRVHADGRRDSAAVVGSVASERASGYPRMVRSGDDVFFAWTEARQPSHVRTAVMRLRRD